MGAFAKRYPGIEVREWELSVDPGPALGRGIFAAPTLLLDGTEILVGIPTEQELVARFETIRSASRDDDIGSRKHAEPAG